MNICSGCGARPADGEFDVDCDLSDVPAGDIMPVGRCNVDDCGSCVYWYPDPIACGHCGDKGYSILHDLEFIACCECKRFPSWLKAFEFFCEHDPLHYEYDLGKLRLVRHQESKPLGAIAK